MKTMIGRKDTTGKMLYLLTKDTLARREFPSKKAAVEFLKDWDKDLDDKEIKATYHFVSFKAKEAAKA